MKKRFRVSIKHILIVILLLALIFTGFELYKSITRSKSSSSISKQVNNQEIKSEKENDSGYIQDATGEEIVKQLKQRGVDMGFISTRNISRLRQKIPIKPIENTSIDQSTLPKYKPLDSIKPIPDTATKSNLLVWDEYKIIAPLNYASFQDIYQANGEGIVDFDKLVNNDATSSPVQQLLINGPVHLPFSPLPGEQGNSYIIGHSSNYSSVKSDYNFVFAPLIEKTQNGQTFYIYDYAGRGLEFKVFESLAVKEDDVKEAYKNFGDRRVVTLQGSILENVNGKQLPTKRWLVRAELVE